MLKTAGIPMWVTIFAIIVFLLGCGLGLMALFGQAMDPTMSASWGGRHLGLGLAAGAAVILRSPSAYLAAFSGGVGRDVGDLIAHLGKSDASRGVLVGIVVFLIAGVLGILAANKARRSQTSAA
jgi:hypothetical protein